MYFSSQIVLIVSFPSFVVVLFCSYYLWSQIIATPFRCLDLPLIGRTDCRARLGIIKFSGAPVPRYYPTLWLARPLYGGDFPSLEVSLESREELRGVKDHAMAKITWEVG